MFRACAFQKEKRFLLPLRQRTLGDIPNTYRKREELIQNHKLFLLPSVSVDSVPPHQENKYIHSYGLLFSSSSSIFFLTSAFFPLTVSIFSFRQISHSQMLFSRIVLKFQLKRTCGLLAEEKNAINELALKKTKTKQKAKHNQLNL